jgi:hypothetical protein
MARGTAHIIARQKSPTVTLLGMRRADAWVFEGVGAFALLIAALKLEI